MGMKWTKKDIKTLCSQLDTLWLGRSPARTASSEQANAETLKKMLDGNGRKEVVLSGLRAMREMHADRYNQECQTIGNALVRDIYGAGRDEFVERFIKLAKLTDADRAVYEALVLRVVREGLPDEVIAYDPTKR
jgi:hypothetical protein